MGLRRHNDVVEVAFVFEEAHVLGGGGGQLLGQRQVVAGRQRVIERSGVHPDADRNTRRSRRGDHLARRLQTADVAGIDAQLGRPASRRLNGDAGVEVDVGHHGQRRCGAHGLKRIQTVAPGDGHAHDLAAGLGQRLDLREVGGHIVGGDVQHRLHCHRSAASHGHVSHHDPPRAVMGLQFLDHRHSLEHISSKQL